MDAWRSFPGVDPDIPEQLLPPAWPRPRAREIFLSTYDNLREPATLRVREVIARHAPAIAEFAAAHR
jgi:phenylacetic acid degradation operon negative regulatory protein